MEIEYTITNPEVRWDSLNVRYAASTIDFMREENQRMVAIGDQTFNYQGLATANFKGGFLLDLEFKASFPTGYGDYASLQMLVVPAGFVHDHPLSFNEPFLLTINERQPIFGPGGPSTWPIGWNIVQAHEIVHGTVTEQLVHEGHGRHDVEHSVPEPGTLVLFAAALVMAAIAGRFDRSRFRHEAMG